MAKKVKKYSRIMKPERETQNHVIDVLLQEMPACYTYGGNLHDEENWCLREDVLTDWLTDTARGEHQMSTEYAANAIRKLREEIMNCTLWEDLSQVSENVYQMLRYGTSYSRGIGQTDGMAYFIDWTHPEANKFEICEEVSVHCNGILASEHRRPDIVIYVNGIALVIIELKRSGVPVTEGIRQNYRNQQSGYIPRFFTTSQLCMAGNPSEGLYYGTTCTPEQFYLKWKEPTGITGTGTKEDKDFDAPTFAYLRNILDRSLCQMLEPTRLLQFIHDCIIYDGGVKKAARPNQYFALRAAIPRIRKKDSGIIWHSQGSGKSLTMVWLAQWIKENEDNARVVIITDRDELDTQITNGMRNGGVLDLTNHDISYYHAESGNDLLTKLDGGEKGELPWLITTLIHKFGHNDSSNQDERTKGVEKSPEQYMKELADRLNRDFPGFKAKGNIIVFVDECHRTQGGVLHKAMRTIMGEDVMIIGFTGTPLLKKAEKESRSSQEAFGRYIHSYRFNEAVKDGVVLDLRYEARNVVRELNSQQAIDDLFDAQTRQLTPKAKEALKDRWAKMQHIYSSRDGMRRVVDDILFDMETKPALVGGYGNAMLVADSIYEAYAYWSIFNEQGFGNHCAVISSYEPDVRLSGGFTGDRKTEEELKYKWAVEMMGEETAQSAKLIAQYEERIKDQFIKRPGEMKLLIVVDKLLTGFDAPAATYLYLDRKMVDHTLFQAICRVNRVNGEQKEFGYIVDYRALFQFIEGAIENYTNGGTVPEKETAGFENADISEMLKSRLTHAKEELEKAMQKVDQLTEPVALPRKEDDYYDYFCFPRTIPADEQEAKIIENTTKRDDFYSAVRTLSRRYAEIAMEMKEAGFTEQEADNIYLRIKDMEELSHAIMQASGDYVDMKRYDANMRALLDRYVTAPRSEKLEQLDDFSFLDIINIDDVTGDVTTDEDVEKELGGQRGVAETLTANVRRVINRKKEQNPAEYKLFSERINRLLEELRQGTIAYKDFLRQIKQVGEQLRQGQQGDPRLDNAAKRDLCSNLGDNVELTLRIYGVAKQWALPHWRAVGMIRKQLLRKIQAELNGEVYDAQTIVNIINAHSIEFPD
ncbi:MAG: HsdR family type I site-specific deoxyribonuclease [Prevotellaceae bacterium]|nr:HsdR family type I site-specific deoxyribonuclease [Candidatus Faecinaster equi]